MITIRLNKRYSAKVIQVYMPTSTHDDEEVESVYTEIDELMTSNKTHYTFIIGDFNASVGKRILGDHEVVGKYGYGIRNDRGNRLIEFAASKKLHIANMWYNKKNRWTWRSPGDRTFHEIDYILTDRISTIKDVTVLNRVNAGSDHRMVRCRVQLNTKIEMKKLITNSLNVPNIKALGKKLAEFQTSVNAKMELIPHNDDVETVNQKITKAVLEATVEVVGLKKRNKAESKISTETRQMLKIRREMKKNTTKNRIEFVELCKTIRKRIRNEIRQYNIEMVEKALIENRSMRKVSTKLKNKRLMRAIKDQNGELITGRDEISERCAQFYEDLYNSNYERPTSSGTTDELIHPVKTSEIERALRGMNRNKAPGPDAIVVEMVIHGGTRLWTSIADLCTACIKGRTVPSSWNESNIILLHKKGDIKDINNYRPISLMSHIGKVFGRVLMNRIEGQLDENQSTEQAGFRKGYSTTDHLHVIAQIIEKTNEYQIPLYMAFIDYEKAFDSVEHMEVIRALTTQGIQRSYVDTLVHMYNNGQAAIKSETISRKFNIKKGVRQGDVTSPKLFNAAIEEVFKSLTWDKEGIRINGEYLNHLRYADDIVLMTNCAEKLENMANQLCDAGAKVGLKMNMKKTKVMHNQHAKAGKIKINNIEVETVDKYIYLGQLINMHSDKTEEVNRRLVAGWSTFNNVRNIMTGKLPMHLKRKVFNQCVLPTLTYGCQTWALTKRLRDRLQVTQRNMERTMLGIKRIDRRTNEWIRSNTKVRDVMETVKDLKWKWAGHVARISDNRWTRKVTEWIPLECARKRGRPYTRWDDEIRQRLGPTWMRVARDRKSWHQHGEAFIQEWI